MNLRQLLKDINPQIKLPDTLIHKVTANSQDVEKNDLFVAVKGHAFNGHDFIEQAVKSGAACIVGEEDKEDVSVPYLKVSNSRLALASIAKNFYGNPSQSKQIIGITGTNGKTTTAYMLKKILEDAGHTCAMFGSVHTIINGQKYPSLNTTPDALQLQKYLAQSKDEYVIMEVSSHGIAQGRIHGLAFDFCLFTNLDHDHLDYHVTMEDYFLIKARIFDALKKDGFAIINTYNDWGRKLSRMLASRPFSIITPSAETKKDDLPSIDHIHTDSADISYQGLHVSLKLNILGSHNIFNALMAFLTASQMNIPVQESIQSLHTFPGIPGRFEMFKRSNGATIIVDYAHTAEAFRNCLTTAKNQGAEKVVHIFGFRGDRDTSKREKMIAVSKEIADETVLTFDDLNDVSPAQMSQELDGLNEGKVISDRTLAIEYAINHAEENDWIIITGKGNEKYQLNFSLPSHSDRETVQYILQQNGTVAEKEQERNL